MSIASRVTLFDLLLQDENQIIVLALGILEMVMVAHPVRRLFGYAKIRTDDVIYREKILNRSVWQQSVYPWSGRKHKESVIFEPRE